MTNCCYCALLYSVPFLQEKHTAHFILKNQLFYFLYCFGNSLLVMFLFCQLIHQPFLGYIPLGRLVHRPQASRRGTAAHSKTVKSVFSNTSYDWPQDGSIRSLIRVRHAKRPDIFFSRKLHLKNVFFCS